jgi:hypothetical protein
MIKIGRGELIHVESRIGELLPRSFRWRGERHSVRQVESTSPASSIRRAGTADETVLAIRTSSGLRCILKHDLKTDTWRMMQVVTRKEGG